MISGRTADAPRVMNHAARTGTAMSVLRRRQRLWSPQPWPLRLCSCLHPRQQFAPRCAKTTAEAVRTRKSVSRWTDRVTGATAGLCAMTAATGQTARTARVGMAATTTVAIDRIRATGTSSVRRSVTEACDHV